MIHKYPYRIHKPGHNQFPNHLQPYVKLVETNEGFEALMEGATEFMAMLSVLPPEKMGYSYQRDKWTVQDVLMHMIDTERMFQNRALRISRKESRALSGFDQDKYVKNLPNIVRSIESIRDEYETVRKGTFLLFAGLTKVEMKLQGRVSNYTLTLPSIPFIIAGHEIHHLNILKERYNIQDIHPTSL
ncbi:DinB family protein [Membranicola marinus]|uniref:DinB family protein n=1 Tax=Membranihabitans marinus TaxID=1227546 RepID=A0A953L8Q0_9BACT|nr:DinB family protein [Membranihabitans marinus]MBY5960057.1 DinB family protein [Membranihabitans marinus]